MSKPELTKAELYEIIEGLCLQYGHRTNNGYLSTGGLSDLEDAFYALGWVDPQIEKETGMILKTWVDERLLDSVKPESLEKYLKTQGWTNTGGFFGESETYRKFDVRGDPEILAPLRRDLGDYSTRVVDILRVLVEVETRSVDSIIADILESTEASDEIGSEE